jgi:hypothetical protein
VNDGSTALADWHIWWTPRTSAKSPKVMPGFHCPTPMLELLQPPGGSMGSSHLQCKGLCRSSSHVHLHASAVHAAETGNPCDTKPSQRAAALHLGCMKTAKVLRLTPAAAGDEALRTKCGVACRSPPEWICIDSPTCSR